MISFMMTIILERADVIALKLERKYALRSYLKYAHGGTISNQVSNFYEVCSKRRSLSIETQNGREFINHYSVKRNQRMATNVVD
ncbi:hypothetical protein CS542_06640 [Pedobacter sp. IW39]|nr:hypothetical protein CS542_06640 [Pedobacter sp. IW39]